MTRGAFEDLDADRCVRPRVPDQACPQRGELAIGIAPGLVLHTDRMALGVEEKRLLARQSALHGPLQQPRGKRRLGLVGHVLLAAERAAVGHLLDDDLIGREPEHGGDLVAVVPHTLTT